MKVFDELLLDADWSVNAGTWMWLSGRYKILFIYFLINIYCIFRLLIFPTNLPLLLSSTIRAKGRSQW